ncbi:MAG TPA: chemotaxis protein CheB [Puia sp.]|jgi:two-component system CheB/CheR fusion protein|nr:chemotaxis protein CheB [Puia sp.]
MDNDKLFPVVAIGASAGGLEAISTFLEHVSPELGMAYVIIQHLSPSHESILPELLERKTRMKVCQVTDGMNIQPNSVYVIPPNTYMSIVDHKLTLSARAKQGGGTHSIDHFLNALAPIYQNNAVAVILSGTASDGTEGVRAIKAEGGITFAQDASAKFSGMPQNAVNSGHVDFVFPPEKIAEELAQLHAFSYTGADSLEIVSAQDQELRKIHLLLFNNLNVDFSNYKQTTITRRILRRMALNKIKDLKDYTRILRENAGELDLLYKDLLINVTSFFREPHLYDAFPKRIFPSILKDRTPAEVIRIWVPACSTGEEVYSIAICLFEYMSDNAIVCPIQLFATDLSEGAIERARTGTYSKMSLEKVSMVRLEKYFIPINGQYQIIKPIRDICIFATHDLLKDPPFSRLNLISCQNIMIYLQPEAQKRILQAFHYALKPNGLLLLGKSETIGKSSELFSPIDKDFKLFTKKSISNNHFDFSVRSNLSLLAAVIEGEKVSTPDKRMVDTDKEAENILLSRYVPASVTVDKDLHILQFYGPTQNYFRPAMGKASFYLMKMVREELAYDVKTMINKAKKDGIAVKKNKITLAEGTVNIEVIPLRPKSKDPVFLILFREEDDPLSPVRSSDREPEGKKSKLSDNEQIKALVEEVKSGREQLKSITEESDANREELQSANEEVLSSNEELQSINEELETSKEELQSTNEELTTINEELYHRNADLKESVEYSNAIIQTMTEPLIVLNSDMRVRTANSAFYKTFKGTPDETEGCYFFQIGKGVWNLQELHKKLEEIFTSDKKYETFELTNDFPQLGSKTLLFNVMQLNHENNKNQRYLLAIQDITDRVNYLRELNSNKEYFRLLVQNAFDIITIYTIDGTVKYQSESLRRVLGYEPEERIGRSERNDGIVHPADVDRYHDMFQRCLATPNSIINQEFRLKHKDGSYRQVEAVCMNLLDNQYINGLVGNYRDITDQKALERQKEEFIAIASHELKTPVTSIKGYSQIIKEFFLNESEPELRDLMQRLNNQVGRLSTLVENLLDVTKITGGQLQLELRLFDINVLIGELVEDVRKTTKMEVVTELQPCDEILGDRERIGQVLTNLLSNAVKYSPSGGKMIIRSAYTAPIGNEKARVTVSVQDFGIGVSLEQQKFIFERYIRVKDVNTNSIPGLGLGLYISSQIIRRHEGSIWVRSTGTEGSVFGFTLPVEANSSSVLKVY